MTKRTAADLTCEDLLGSVSFCLGLLAGALSASETEEAQSLKTQQQ